MKTSAGVINVFFAVVASGTHFTSGAQSSVIVSGVLDVGVQWNKYGVNQGSVSAPDWRQEGAVGVEPGYLMTNRLGIRGVTAIGGGWDAVFALDSGFNIVTGNLVQGGRLFGLQAWAGLQGPVGTVAFGRIATPSSAKHGFDMFGAVDVAAMGIAAAGSSFIAAAGLREDNSVIFVTPELSGFRFAVQHSFNVDTAETAPQGSNTRATNLGASYNSPPFYLVATYDVFNFADAGSSSRPGAGNPDEKLLQLGASVDFTVVKIGAAYAKQDNISFVLGSPGINSALSGLPIPVGVGNYNNSAYLLGAAIPLLGGSLVASYQYSDAKPIETGSRKFEPDYQLWGVGFLYYASRRTNVYFGYAQRNWRGSMHQTSGASIDAAAILNREQLALGLRHFY